MLPGPTEVIACPHCEAPHRRATLTSGNTLGATWWSDGKMVAPMLPELPAMVRCGECRRLFWMGEARKLGELPLGLFGREAETSWQVVLETSGANRVPLMAELRRRLGLSLAEAREVVDDPPRVLASSSYTREARELKASLEDLGANVVLRSSRDDEPPPKPALPSNWGEATWVEHPSEGDYLDALEQRLWNTSEQEVFLRLRAWWAGNDSFRNGAPWVPLAEREDRPRDNARKLLGLLREERKDEGLLKAELAREFGDFAFASRLLESLPTQDQPLGRELVEELARRCGLGLSEPFSVQAKPEHSPRPPRQPAKEKRWRVLGASVACPHCQTEAARFRDLGDRLVCGTCGRSFGAKGS